MPPKKTVEKTVSPVILDLKPRKGVRKKTPTPKSLLGGKLNTSPVTELFIPNEDCQDPEYVPQKITKAKVAKKINIPLNGIKPLKPCRGKLNNSQVLFEDLFINATPEEPSIAEDSPQNIKRRRIVKKPKRNAQVDEVPDQMVNSEDVLQKNNKTKANKQNLSHTEVVDNYEVLVSVADALPDCVPKKIRKARTPRAKKQIQIEIKPLLGDEAPDDSHSVEVPKIRRRRPPQNKQNQIKIENIPEIDTHVGPDEPQDSPEVTPKIKKPKCTKKNQNNEIKIMLANEVIRNAFKKKPALVPTPRPRPRRPGRKKAICNKVKEENNEPNKLPDGHDDIPDVAKKKTARKSCTVTLEDASQELAISESPVTEEVPKKRRKLSLKRKTIAVMPVIDQTSQNTKTVNEGKEETQNSKQIDSNATLLTSNESTAPDSTKIDCGTQSRKTNNISCRKNSDTSVSTCFSWTKDISSSSTTTCVTVKSSDFVRIDKKLPIIMLANVDNQINRNRHIQDNIFEENSFVPDQKSKCPSECSSVSMTNLNVSQTLNLSTSSLTSVTSTAHDNSANKENKDERIMKLQQSLENLSSKMKNFDLEIINWIGYENENKNAQIKNFHARIFEVLNYENEVIKYCKEIKRVLVEDQQSEVVAECPEEIEEACPEPVVNNLAPDDPKDKDDPVKENNIFETAAESQKDKDTRDADETGCDEIFDESKSFNKNFDVEDDDDALSLFAESITGLESSRKNSSFSVPVCNDKSATQPDIGETLRVNERVKQPINIDNDKAPSKKLIVLNNVKKQTADSSTVVSRPCDSDLINKFQTDNSRPVTVDRFKVDDSSVSFDRFQHISDIAVNNKPNKSLFSSMVEYPDIHASPCENFSNRSTEFQNYRDSAIPYSLDNNSFNVSQDIRGIPGNISENWNNKISFTQDNSNAESLEGSENSNLANPTVEQNDKSLANLLEKASNKMYAISSVIFKGVCIFNLISTCKNVFCNFHHIPIDVEFVRSQLQEMDETMFVKEWMYIFRWHMLKRKFGVCFVEECIRRNLTLLLLHLVKKFITKTSRSPGEEAFITEIVENTLLHLNEADMKPCADILRSKIKKTSMCDYFMKAISETQNFSRFKNVFLKITLFICHIGRSFRLDVATQLLERLCILPYDDALARALLKIIGKTNPSIFNVPMMRFLENQLAKNNSVLHKELLELRQQAASFQGASSPPTQSSHVASSNGPQTSTPVARADSPDTTNMDFVNKAEEPVITRTITINRTINTNNLNSVGSESSEEPTKRYEPRKPHAHAHTPAHAHAHWRPYPPNLMSLRPQRQVYKRLGFAPRAFSGAQPKFRRRPPQEPY